MVYCPDQLVWEIIKNHNSFIRKVNGRKSRTGAMRFSVERGNPRNVSNYQQSGLANSKCADVFFTTTGAAVLLTKTSSKASQPKRGYVHIPLTKNFSRSVKAIRSQVDDNYYRRDMTRHVLAKYSKVYQANRIAKGVKKPVSVKKGRRS